MKEKLKQIMTYKVVKKLIFAVDFFTTRGVINAASALTYSTILSLVPICAVVFAIARGFGYTKYIEEWFRSLLSSQPQAADFIIGFVNSYLEHTKSGIILGIGLVFMLYTVVMLTRNVEQTFNDIWHVENRKNIMRTFTDYISIFFLIPIVIIVMSGLSLFVSTIAQQADFDILIGPLMQLLVDVIPFILMWMAFTGLYVLMPNTKVKFICCVVPGLLATVAMCILQWFYINAQMFISNYNAIYGSFAALPLFMLWVQFSWTICLFCAELSYTNQNLEEFAFISGAQQLSHKYKSLLSILIMSRICNRFNEGKRPYTAVELKTVTGIPVSIIRDLLYAMVQAHLLIEIPGEKDHDDVMFLPSISIDKINVGTLIDKIDNIEKCEIPQNIKTLIENNSGFDTILRSRSRYLHELEAFEMKDI